MKLGGSGGLVDTVGIRQGEKDCSGSVNSLGMGRPTSAENHPQGLQGPAASCGIAKLGNSKGGIVHCYRPHQKGYTVVVWAFLSGPPRDVVLRQLVAWPRENDLRVFELYQLAQPEQAGPIGHACRLLHIMGDNDDTVVGLERSH